VADCCPRSTLASTSHAQAEAPKQTSLAFHTLHFPRLNGEASDGTLQHPTISRHAHVAQLNAAGRQLAARHGFQVETHTLELDFGKRTPLILKAKMKNYTLNVAPHDALRRQLADTPQLPDWKSTALETLPHRMVGRNLDSVSGYAGGGLEGDDGRIPRRFSASLPDCTRWFCMLNCYCSTQVVDLEAMTDAFHNAEQYLVDNTHPAAWFSRCAISSRRGICTAHSLQRTVWQAGGPATRGCTTRPRRSARGRGGGGGGGGGPQQCVRQKASIQRQSVQDWSSPCNESAAWSWPGDLA